MDMKTKALEVVEAIACHRCEEEEAWADLYMISHIALGNCKNPHLAWVDKLDKLWQETRGDSNDQ